MLPDLAITETIDKVIVYHADGLHVGIYDRRTNETEPATLKVLAEGIRFDRSRRNLSRSVHDVKFDAKTNQQARVRVACARKPDLLSVFLVPSSTDSSKAINNLKEAS